VLAAGVATTHFGLHQTAVVYSAALAVLAAAAAGSLMIRRRSRPGSPSAPPEALRASRQGLRKRLASRALVRGARRAFEGEHVAQLVAVGYPELGERPVQVRADRAR
jgi:hypothetical protein